MSIREHYYARYPFVYFQTTEDERLIRESRALFDAKPVDDEAPPLFFTWDCAAGLQAMVPVNGHGWTFRPVDAKMTDPLKIFEVLRCDAIPEGAVIWMRDFHKFLDPQAPASIKVIRQALNLKGDLKRQRKTIAFLSAVKVIPPELKDDVTVLDFEYPNEEALRAIVSRLAQDNSMGIPDNADAVINALRGLTAEGAENALALALTTMGIFDVKTLLDQKAAQLKTGGVLEFSRFQETLDSLWGMEKMKRVILKSIMHPECTGFFLYGVPGAGKSHFSKGLANAIGWPCLTMSFRGMRSKYQGEAEAKLNDAFKSAMAFGNCIIFMDEFDKDIAGIDSADTDGGVGAGLFGKWLSFVEDAKGKGPKFICTGNSMKEIQNLSGGAGMRRFNAFFFIDMPTPKEARGIASIWSKAKGVEIPGDFDFKDYCGADIAKLASTMKMMECPAEEAAQYIIPYGRANADKLAQIREEAKGVCIWANEDEPVNLKQTRKVRRAA